jgi:hypothetical protein
MFLEDLPIRQRPVKSTCLRFTFSSSSELEESSLEVEVAQGSTRLRHDLLELLLFLLLVSEAVLLVVTLVAAVVSVGVVVLIRGVKLFPLGAVDDEAGGVTALKTVP